MTTASKLSLCKTRMSSVGDITSNYDETIRLLEEAAGAGSAEACFLLGRVLHFRAGDDENQRGIATKWLHKGATHGSPQSVFLLCNNYPDFVEAAYSKSVEQVAAEAYEENRKLADSGDSDALYMLGVWTEFGFGCIEDENESERLYLAAAELGSADAMFAYADRLLMKEKVDADKAARWVTLAIELGHAEAHTLLPVIESLRGMTD